MASTSQTTISPELPFVVDLQALKDGHKQSIPFASSLAPFNSGTWSVCSWSNGSWGVASHLTHSFEWEVRWANCAPARVAIHLDVRLDGYRPRSSTTTLERNAEGLSPSSKTGAYRYPIGSLYGGENYATITLRVDSLGDEPYRPTASAQVLAERQTMNLDVAQPNDVRFFLPRSNRELWANSKILSAASPYWKDMLASEFKEGIKETATCTTGSASGPSNDKEPGDVYFEDSDEEIDEICAFQRDTSCPQSSSYHPLTVNSMAFTTLRAILVWLYSSHITFAPTVSSFSPDKYSLREEARAERDEQIRRFHAEHPSLPLPSSPKSVYRAAHLLQLPELKKLSLQALKSQLEPATVAHELLGDVASHYEEIRDAELDFAVQHWSSVRDSTAMKQMEALADAGELPEPAAGTLLKLETTQSLSCRFLLEMLGP